MERSPVEERTALLRRLRLTLVERLDEVAAAIAEDTGKVPAEVLASDVLPLLEAVSYVERHAAKLLRPRRVPTPLMLAGRQSYIEYRPRGVVLVNAPWNFPLQLTVVPAVYALPAGSTVVIKPSEVTPWTGVWVERLFAWAGVPDGVVQVAHGGKELGAALVEGTPDYIFFTGSTRTGRIIQAKAAERLIPTTLELGGKDPMLVFEYAPLDRAVAAAAWGALFNAGQVCLSVERVYVHRSVYDAFVDQLVETVRQVRQGMGPDDDVGAMTSPAQIAVVRDHVMDALSQGAVLRTGLHPDEWRTDAGWFMSPMVLTGVHHGMRVMREETFGPVLPVMPFDTEEEAIRLANDCDYGLGASVWTADPDRGRRVAARLVCGSVLVNDTVASIVNHRLPYGGEKASGLGRYHGPDGLRIFCRETAVMVQRLPLAREVHWFPYRGKHGPFRDLIRAYYGPRRRWGAFVRAYLALVRAGRAADQRLDMRKKEKI